MNKNILAKAAAGLVVLLGVAPMSAHATFSMTLTDGTHTKYITDGSVMDKSSQAGVILWIGQLGGIWSGNVSVAISKPTIGGPLNPQLDFSMSNLSSTGPGTLTITITDTGFGPFPGNTGLATLTVGGTLSGGSVSASGMINGSPVVTLGPYTTPTWSGQASAIASGLSSSFSVSEQIVINHTGAGIDGGDIFFNVIPEPTTWIAGALLVLPLGASAVRILRRGRA